MVLRLPDHACTVTHGFRMCPTKGSSLHTVSFNSFDSHGGCAGPRLGDGSFLAHCLIFSPAGVFAVCGF